MIPDAPVLHLLVRVVLVLFLLVLGLRWFEQRQVFVPSRTMEQMPDAIGLDYEDIDFIAEDGVRLHGWWIPHPQARGTVLYCHGNGNNISSRIQLAADLRRYGLNVFLFDYRGYGQSRGWPSEKGVYRDARAAFEVVRARYEDAEQPPVVAYGASLGGPIAAQLALDKPVKGLVIEASFPSTLAMGQALYPWLPTRGIMRYRFDTEAKLAQSEVPKLLANSREDDLVPYELGVRLYEAARPPKEWVELRGPHDEGGWNLNPAYAQALETFFTRALGNRPDQGQ